VPSFFCRLTGYTEAELIADASPLRAFAMVVPEDRERCNEELLVVGHALTAEVRFTHRDGRVMWVNVRMNKARSDRSPLSGDFRSEVVMVTEVSAALRTSHERRQNVPGVGRAGHYRACGRRAGRLACLAGEESLYGDCAQCSALL
jgi:PAS domain S-box-containing protein